MDKTLFEKQTGETCLICDEIKHDGIHILGWFLCSSCEQKLIKTETNDASYAFYLKKLRKLTMNDYAKEH